MRSSLILSHMKILKNFKDLAEAIEYITQINEAYLAESAEKGALKSELATIKSSLVTAQTELSKSTGELSIANTELNNANLTIANLKEEVAAGAENTALVVELQTSLNESLNEVAELGTKIGLLEKNRGDKSLIVVVKGKSYKLLGNRFITKNGEVNAEELSKDKPELERMLKISSGSLILVD